MSRAPVRGLDGLAVAPLTAFTDPVGLFIVYRRLRLSREPPGPDRIIAVDVTTSPSFRPGTARVIAEGTFSPRGDGDTELRCQPRRAPFCC